MSLRTTIQEIHTRDRSLTALKADRDEFLRQWNSDLSNLYTQIKNFLSQFEKDGLLVFGNLTCQVAGDEDTLGKYTAPALGINIANRQLYCVPFARLTSGGEGRVDLYKEGRQSNNDKIYIVRRVDEEANLVWKIEEKDANLANPMFKLQSSLIAMAGGTKNYADLTPYSLEKALDYLLHL